jgi:hypothetical protein
MQSGEDCYRVIDKLLHLHENWFLSSSRTLDVLSAWCSNSMLMICGLAMHARAA